MMYKMYWPCVGDVFFFQNEQLITGWYQVIIFKMLFTLLAYLE